MVSSRITQGNELEGFWRRENVERVTVLKEQEGLFWEFMSSSNTERVAADIIWRPEKGIIQQ